MTYCKCGSLRLAGACTNKRCTKHVAGVEYATYKQVNYVQDMLLKLGDDTIYDYKNMTVAYAKLIISELLERVEVGE